MTRREFLKYSMMLSTLGLTRCVPKSRNIPGRIMGAAAAIGHRLREDNFPKQPTKQITAEYAIIGGGVAGLAAAWWLQKKGKKSITILELAEQVGGNAAWGQNEHTAYPWGAHYLPCPGPELPILIEFLRECGAVSGEDAEGWPIFSPEYICMDLEERLFIHGQWQEGLFPQLGLTQKEQAQALDFQQTMQAYRFAKGKDNRFAFCFPVDNGSTDEAFRSLDKISMATFMEQKGWDAAPLQWYVDYCCRDDYGCPASQTSAWAGIHYFAGRRGKDTKQTEPEVLTWPQGNGWLIQQFIPQLHSFIQPNSLVYQIIKQDKEVFVDYIDIKEEKSIRIIAEKCIIATPRFITQRLIKDLPLITGFSYSPWLVANIQTRAVPQSHKGAPLAWDNVSYHHRSLGYVVANHQSLATYQLSYTLTYYQPLDDQDPQVARVWAYSQSYESWQKHILQELQVLHPQILPFIDRIDVWLWGHGMIRPTPGFIWGDSRQIAQKPMPPLYFAHSDLGGISVFEEAFHQGIRAAEESLL